MSPPDPRPRVNAPFGPPLTAGQWPVRTASRRFTSTQHARGTLWTGSFRWQAKDTPHEGFPKPLYEAPSPRGASPLDETGAIRSGFTQLRPPRAPTLPKYRPMTGECAAGRLATADLKGPEASRSCPRKPERGESGGHEHPDAHG